MVINDNNLGKLCDRRYEAAGNLTNFLMMAPKQRILGDIQVKMFRMTLYARVSWIKK